MTLPVSSYEELLVQVRELTHETILLQRQLSFDLFDDVDPSDVNHNFCFNQRNYEKGKHLTDNVIHQSEKSRTIEAGHSSLAECNDRPRPRFYQNLETSQSIRSAELASRLLAWKSRNHQAIILKQDAETSRKRAERSLLEENHVALGSVVGVGVETIGSWGSQRHPHGTEVPTPLSNVAAHKLESSADAAAAAFNPVVVATAATSTRCSAVKNLHKIPSSSSSSSAVNVIDPRPRLYLSPVNAETNKEDVMDPEVKEEDERRSSTPSPEVYVRRNKRYNESGSSEEESKPDSSLQSHRLPSSYRGTWPIRKDLWANQQMGFSTQQSTSTAIHNDVASVMSFSSNSGAALGCSSEMQGGGRRLGAKVDVVYNLLGMLGSTEGREDMSATLLSMSNSVDNCLIMRQSGCLPLLVQLIHAPGQVPETRDRASTALHNVVHAKSDERAGRREARVLRFLEQLRDYCQALRVSLETRQIPEDLERHPGPTIAALMKLSFDEAHRHAMCQLGGLHAVAELIEMDHMAHGSECDDQNCITLRRYAGMALTNLTFGDGNNKALLCSFREFMKALVSQLRSPSDDLRQVTASVLRNLSWRADTSSKQTLREVGAVTGLMKAAMEGRKESTLKSILSALWNLSAHCSTNKVDICAVEGALAFLVDMLSYVAPSKTLAIVENAGGILRNVSSHIAVREDYRAIVRERGCLQVLLQQLRSPSLTVVSNACGALWNLSARCPQDQRLLWDLGAVPMLRSLVHSKHKMISMGSSAALKNLLSARPGCNNLVHLDSTARGLGLPTLPTLVARRQRALEQEIDQNLAETCDNIEPSTSPTNKDDKFSFKVDHSFLGINARTLRSYQLHNQQPNTSAKCNNGVARSESRDSMRSITSTHSDTMFERVNRHVLNGGTSPTDIQIKQQSSSLHSAVGFDGGVSSNDSQGKNSSEKQYALRYKNAIPERLKPFEGFNADLRCTNSTISWASTPDQESGGCSQNLLHSSVDENFSSIDRDLSKASNQSSVTEDTELTVCAKTSEYQRVSVKSAIDPPTTLSFVGEASSSGIKDGINFGNISVLHQSDSLNAIQKAISPTVGGAESSLYSDYAETDLDQPTDYSLRYAETSLEDEEKQHSAYYVTTEQELIHEDTVKTYYTEGTPHGTSLNCSRAASATDLQEDSRVRNLSRKLLEPNKSQIKRNNYDSLEHPKISSFVEDKSEVNLRCATEVEDKKSQALHYFEGNVEGGSEYQSVENVEKIGHSSARSTLSLRTSPTQASSDILEYNGTDNVTSNSAKTTSNRKMEYESQCQVFEESQKLDKNFPTNGVGFYPGSTLKASNDSGYQVSDGDEDDEDLLTACINIGMQNNRSRIAHPKSIRHRHSFIGNSFEKLPRTESNLARYQTSGALDQMECNTTVDQTNSQGVLIPEICEHNVANISASSSTIALDDQNGIKSTDKITENTVFLERLEESLPSQSDQVRNDEVQYSLTVNDNICNFSLPPNSRNSPIRLSDEATAFIAESNQEQYLSNIDKRADEVAATSPVKTNLVEDESRPLQRQEEKTADTMNTTIGEASSQKSYEKITDSESSESIDSVERSEHALLELCIQPGITKTVEEDIKTKETTKKSDRTSNESDDYSTESNSRYKEACEVDGPKPQERTNEVLKSSRKNSCDHVKHAEQEVLYRRQRDPDAMIASLDRLTATLVQQTEAIRERDSSAMKQSILSDTWNEDSPNEVSFPSISLSTPYVASFKSEEQATITSEYDTANSENPNIMTDSKIIQREAIKLAEAVDAEIKKHHHESLEATSMTSMDLEAIKPPSYMGSLLSLTASYAGPGDNNDTFLNRDRCNSTSLPPVQLKSVSASDCRNTRKKSLPLGVVAKRALSQGQSYTGSLENLLNECTGSHLENVKPPSMMDELPDVGDMENSMLSVASITSEIADPKEHDSHSSTGSDAVFDLMKPVANVLSMTCMRYAEGYAMQGGSANNSLSECLENINPPSLFNEVCELDESTIEPEPTDTTICSDTLCIDVELNTEEGLPHRVIADKVVDEGENDTDEAGTPISSEYCVSSSAESTPKKRLHKNLTPKQKRNLAKERYKTYTIAAEYVKKEEERRKQESTKDEGRIQRGKCSPFTKLTPKQRRQEDRARFQTQVLDNPFSMNCIINQDSQQGAGDALEYSEENLEATSPARSSLPSLTKLPVCKALRMKRVEQKKNRERYRTRTLNDSESILRATECNSEASTDLSDNIKPDEIQTMLEQNATIVLNTLNESRKPEEEDPPLDCETLSLVSNESETERNLRLQFVNGLSKKLIVSCRRQMEVPRDVDDQVEASRRQEEFAVESDSEDESNNAEEPPRETKRPRIIKPGMVRDVSTDSNVTDDKSEPESPKAIRGRRKALYSTPITRKSTPQSSPLKQANSVSGIPIGRSNTSPIVRATRATTLRTQNNNSPNVARDSPNTSPRTTSNTVDNEKRTRNASVPSKRASVPQKGSSLTFTKSMKRHSTPSAGSSNFPNDSRTEAPVKMLERQGTFTKDEPEVENAPTVVSTSSSPIKTKIAKPIRGATSKIYPAGGKSKLSPKAHQSQHSKVPKGNNSEKIQAQKGLPLLVTPRRLPPGKANVASKVPSGNQNLPQNENSKAFRKISSLGQRSSSNSSIVSNASGTGIPTRKLAKEATSKIASLWKKVEESKRQQRLEKPDTRQWLQPGGNCSADAVDNVSSSTTNEQPPAFRLFRSSTFEGVSQEEDGSCTTESSLYKLKSKRPLAIGVQAAGKVKYRNSCDLSGMNAIDQLCKIPVMKSSCDTSTYKKDSSQVGENTVILRRQQSVESSTLMEADPTKRISRLGSFIRVEATNGESNATTQSSVNGNNVVRTTASAIVQPFNYNPKQDIPSQTKVTTMGEMSEQKFGLATDCHSEIVTGSSKVTTV